jgi:hypothetical protein
MHARRIAQAAAFFVLAALLPGGCNGDINDICAHRLPEFDRALASAETTLSEGATNGRVPASSRPALGPADREQWKTWAEQRLKEAQHYIDAVEGEVATDKLVRGELSDIATELVSFHGYARQGKSDRMVRALERIREHSSRARELACPGGRARGDGA